MAANNNAVTPGGDRAGAAAAAKSPACRPRRTTPRTAEVTSSTFPFHKYSVKEGVAPIALLQDRGLQVGRDVLLAVVELPALELLLVAPVAALVPSDVGPEFFGFSQQI